MRDIDGERGLLRVEQGKGAKDRLVTLSPGLLDTLRSYWKAFRPAEWLFPSGRDMTTHLSIDSAQRVFMRAKNRAGVEKIGGIHSLRHYSACLIMPNAAHYQARASPAFTPRFGIIRHAE